jgi:hypothetical protein
MGTRHVLATAKKATEGASVMGYRKITRMDARRMAKAAGLRGNQIYRCDFRDGMAEHAAKLLIAWTVKRKRVPICRG